MPPLLLLLIGLVLLLGGAEALVRGASRLALAMGISRLVVGLVIVSLGTSAPEVAISVGAAWQGQGDLAIGNVVGSNTFNVLLILGTTALVAPLVVGRRLVRLDIPIMVGISLVFAFMAIDGIGRIDGTVLLAMAVGYVGLNLWLGRREAGAPGTPSTADVRAETPAPDHAVDVPATPRRLALPATLALVGLALLVLGARFAVDGASELARAWGASDLVIGLTVVAAGTSLPELATSVLAVLRGEREIAVGNIVGSNILNLTLILGLASWAGGGVEVARGAMTLDIPVMVVAAAVILPMAFTGHVIARWEGALFVAFYAAYTAHLVLTATAHPAREEFGFALRWFVLPLAFTALAATLVQEVRRRRAA